MVLRRQHLLLLLDNFEHVIDAATTGAALLSRALRLRCWQPAARRCISPASTSSRSPRLPSRASPASPTARASRELRLWRSFPAGTGGQARLGLDDRECLRSGGGLHPVGPAVSGQRAAAGPIELFSPAEMRFSRLIGRPRDLPSRHQALRNAIDWSYELLSQEEQQLFTRLAVFVAGWTLETAEAVCIVGESRKCRHQVQRRSWTLSSPPEYVPRIDSIEEARQLAGEGGGKSPAASRHPWG